jgi:hypothetical protein
MKRRHAALICCFCFNSFPLGCLRFNFTILLRGMTVKFPAIANLFKRDQAVNQLELPLPPSLIPAVKKNIDQDSADALGKLTSINRFDS